MKKLITLLVGCSMVAAFGAPADQKNVKKKPAQKQPQPHVAPAPQRGGMKPHVQTPHGPQPGSVHNAAKIHGGNLPKQQQVHTPSNFHPNKKTNIPANNVNPEIHNQVDARDRVHANVPGVNKANKFHGVNPSGVAANASNLPAVQATGKAAAQNIRAQHANFHARPNTNVASVQYNQGYRIAGAENWRGARYEAFRSYQPVWHDRSWWHNHYSSVVLFGGGWYFWNAGYWYPAWGYDPGAAYYPYDGPIYTGSTSRRVDQVIADVQSVLQQEGYYHGEVDGLLGPLTRDALSSYQSAQGLEPTAAIDQPTLESLGLT